MLEKFLPFNLLTLLNIMKTLNYSIIQLFNISIIFCLVSIVNANSDYTILGTLRDYNGALVRDGYVMVEQNPHLFAKTDHNGTFSITGSGTNLPVTLWASWAGCDVLTTNLGSVTNVTGLSLQLAQQDSELTKLEIGCSHVTSRRMKFSQLGAKIVDTAYTPEQQICVDAYTNFMATIGDTMRTNVLAGNELTGANRKYRFMIYADIGSRAKIPGSNGGGTKEPECTAFADDLIDEWDIIRERYYQGDILTTNDLETIRRVSAMWDVVGGVIPGQFAPRDWYAPWLGGTGHRYVNLGEQLIADISLMKLKSAVKLPQFSNLPSQSATEFIRLEGLHKYLMPGKYYTLDGDGHVVPQTPEVLRQLDGMTDADYVTTHDLLGDGKPILVCQATLEDRTQFYRWRLYNHLYRAYKDQAHIYSIDFPSPAIGDMFIDDMAYYGTNPPRDVLNGVDYRFAEVDYTTERSARIGKIGHMETPTHMIPTLVGNGSMVERYDFAKTGDLGSQRLTLVDDAGKVVLRAKDGVRFQDKDLGTYYSHKEGLGYLGDIFTEICLRRLFDLDGGIVSNINEFIADLYSPPFPERQMLPKTSGWAEHGIGCFEITSIDTNASIIQADYKARGDSETNNYTFSVDAGTRIVLKNGDVFSKTNLSALSVGNKLVIEFPIDEKVEPRPHLLVSGGTSENESDYYTDFVMTNYLAGTNLALRIINYTIPSANKLIEFFGTIESMDPVGKTITVQMPPITTNTVTGYGFWKNAEGADITYAYTDKAEGRMEILDRWAAANAAGRLYTFVIDDSVWIWKNGICESDFNDLQIGDQVTVGYEEWYEIQHQGQIDIYPDMLLASHPLGVYITTTSMPNGQMGAAYSQTLTSTNGEPPFVWSLNSGILPDGLSLSTNGVISGTPTTLGESVFSVKITDKYSHVDTQELSINIVPESVGIVCSVIALCALLR